jgi:hypothetical protein
VATPGATHGAMAGAMIMRQPRKTERHAAGGGVCRLAATRPARPPAVRWIWPGTYGSGRPMCGSPIREQENRLQKKTGVCYAGDTPAVVEHMFAAGRGTGALLPTSSTTSTRTGFGSLRPLCSHKCPDFCILNSFFCMLHPASARGKCQTFWGCEAIFLNFGVSPPRRSI